MRAVETDEDGRPVQPPPAHVAVIADRTPASLGQPRVYVRWRTASGEMRVIPFRPEHARALAAELLRATDAIAADAAPIPVTP